MEYHSGEIPEIGDRVRALILHEGHPEVGTEGTVYEVSTRFVGVAFDGLTRGHLVNGVTNGWYTPSSYLDKIPEVPEDISKYEELLLPEKSFLIDNGGVYELNRLPRNNIIHTLLKSRDTAAREMFQNALATLKRQKDKWR